jgi:hypothetical protein
MVVNESIINIDYHDRLSVVDRALFTKCGSPLFDSHVA